MAKQKQLNTIIGLVRDGGWYLPRELKSRFHLLTGKDIDVSSVKARLRDLRKDPYRCRVDKRPHFKGSRELEYRVTGLGASAGDRTPQRRRPSALEMIDKQMADAMKDKAGSLSSGTLSAGHLKAGPERRLTSGEVSPHRPPGEHVPARPQHSYVDVIDMSRSGLPRGDLD